MPNILSYLFASAYSGFTPWLGAASGFCIINGQLVSCPTAPPGVSAASLLWLLFYVAIWIFVIVAMWNVFLKAGKPGWAAIIPIYNSIVLIQIAGKPIWWILLYLIPFVNIVFSVIVIYNLAKNFGKGGGFAAGLIFLPFIFYPILAFGKSTYMPAGQPAAPTAMPPQVPPVIPQQPISQ